MNNFPAAAATVEEMLEPLIVQHGIERVQADLARLVGSARWSDWQSLSNIARNVHNRLERRKAGAV